MPTSHTYDVAIIGAGPAGASAALHLAAKNLNILLIEKSQLPRYKTCGGGLLPRALKLLNDPNIPTEHLTHRVDFILSEKLHFTVTRPDPLITMTMRDTLDAHLVARATAAGVHLQQNSTVQDLAQHADHIALKTTTGPLTAKYLIAADGANSLIAKKAGFPDHRRLVPALECEATTTPEDFARLSAATRFDFAPIPQGYAWVFPKKSHLSLGLLTMAPHQNLPPLHTLFTQYLHYLNLTPLTLQRHGYVIPLTPRKLLAKNRILLTGDAAGLADPITAEGITHAIWSAQLAAQAIAENFQNPTTATRTYNALLQTHILPELRWSRRLAHIIYKMPRLRQHLFIHHGQRLTDLMTQIITGEKTYRELLTQPANYFKLFR